MDYNLDLVALAKLHSVGKQTRSQLYDRGVKRFIIEKLLKHGIMESEYDPNTNLTYYKVKDDIFPGK